MSMSTIVDLSHPLDTHMSIYPGDPSFTSCPHLTLSSDGVRVQKLTIGSHTGTHIDAPSHFIAEGRTVDDIPLSDLIGTAVVVDLTASGIGKDLSAREVISWSHLADVQERIITLVQGKQNPIVLIRTGWSRYWATDKYADHPYVSTKVAQKLVDLGVRVIGIDAFSPDETVVEPRPGHEPSFAVHQIILGAGAVIAENLTNLEALAEGQWVVSLVPLKIGGCDGSPVRACAWRKGIF